MSYISQGMRIVNVPYNAADFYGKGVMTFGVDAADLLVYKVILFRKLTWLFLSIQNASCSGGDDTLYIKMPSYVIPASSSHAIIHLDLGGNFELGHIDVIAGSNILAITRVGAVVNFPNIVDAMHIGITLVFD